MCYARNVSFCHFVKFRVKCVTYTKKRVRSTMRVMQTQPIILTTCGVELLTKGAMTVTLLMSTISYNGTDLSVTTMLLMLLQKNGDLTNVAIYIMTF